jgi:plastocyanin
MSRWMRGTAILIGLVAFLVAAGCSQGMTTTTPSGVSSESAASSALIGISGPKLRAPTVRIAPGGLVVWQAQDIDPESLALVSVAGTDVPVGSTTSLGMRLYTPGEYAYRIKARVFDPKPPSTEKEATGTLIVAAGKSVIPSAGAVPIALGGDTPGTPSWARFDFPSHGMLVTMVDGMRGVNLFSLNAVIVHGGDTVRWGGGANAIPHRVATPLTVTDSLQVTGIMRSSPSGEASAVVYLSDGEAFEHVFDTPGRYVFSMPQPESVPPGVNQGLVIVVP